METPVRPYESLTLKELTREQERLTEELTNTLAVKDATDRPWYRRTLAGFQAQLTAVERELCVRKAQAAGVPEAMGETFTVEIVDSPPELLVGAHPQVRISTKVGDQVWADQTSVDRAADIGYVAAELFRRLYDVLHPHQPRLSDAIPPLDLTDSSTAKAALQAWTSKREERRARNDVREIGSTRRHWGPLEFETKGAGGVADPGRGRAARQHNEQGDRDLMTQAEAFVATFESDVDEHPDNLIHGKAEEVPGTDEVVEEHRWYNLKEVVYRFPDGSFVEFTYESPATEMQEGGEWHTHARVVVPREVTRTIYVTPETVEDPPEAEARWLDTPTNR